MLTKKQKRVLDYIEFYTQKHGFSPSHDEMRKHLKLSSVSTVNHYMKILQDKDYISREKNTARSVEIGKKKHLVNIPFKGYIAAGQPIEVVEEYETIAVPSSFVSTGNLFALGVKGDSMIDEGIFDGDTVIVRKQSSVEDGETAVALINNNEVTLKKIYKEKNRIRLEPANPRLKPLYVKEVIIQGKVISTFRNIEEQNNKEGKTKLDNIYRSDCVEFMKSMDENSVDLTVTSPPYDELRDYKGYSFDFESIAKQLFRVTKKGGVVVWVVGDKIKKGNKTLTSFKQSLFFQQIGFNVHDVMIYRKKNTPFMRSNAYTNCFEFMFVFSKDSPKTFIPLKVKTVRQGKEMLPFNKGADGVNKKILGELKPEKTMTNIWEYAVGYGGSTSDRLAFEHPAIFPERLAEDHILSWTKVGDVVFDPMCGSGTTCKMAAFNKRHYLGCDISQEYVELAKKRLKNALQ
ncbi:MAG: Modification methylase [Parcubacteria group bacterium GW2011_GWD1_44_9]|nr:MAG: Modification methylase [Parcubacteria group bacterium GW2011_GWD1_44_9]